MVTHAQLILDCLWSIAPDGATNGELARRLGIRSQQSVYLLTRQLVGDGRIHGVRSGSTWVFYADEGPSTGLALGRMWTNDTEWAAAFEASARRALAIHHARAFSAGSVPGVRKRFAFVSQDGRTVGDAKYFSEVGGPGLPPAKFSTIAEHIWLLEKTNADSAFLVFGGDREVPIRWLERHGQLASAVAFYFLTDEGGLERLHSPDR
jgi:hypothetical protein